MKVKDTITLLEEYDPDDNVYVSVETAAGTLGYLLNAVQIGGGALSEGVHLVAKTRRDMLDEEL